MGDNSVDGLAHRRPTPELGLDESIDVADVTNLVGDLLSLEAWLGVSNSSR